MKNYKILNKQNLINNINYCKNKYNIMAMVKANAYGHGYKQIAKILNNYVEWYGVANEVEAINLRKVTNKKILIVGKSLNYEKLILKNISITIDSIDEIKQINKLATKLKCIANLHIKINTGMNRLGIKNLRYFKLMVSLIINSKYLKLEGVFTHCFDADEKENNFSNQMKEFEKYVDYIKDKHVLIHIGGSYVLNHKLPHFINLVRVGYFLYGYGNKYLKPIMTIESEIIEIQDCKKLNFVGYGKTQIKKDKKIAIVPFGYADGFSRSLSKLGCVLINNQECSIIGNVCMDMIMVDITNVNAKIGTKVQVFTDAIKVAKIVKTSPYEILTNFMKARCIIKISNKNVWFNY